MLFTLETVEPGEDDVFQPISLEHGRSRIETMRATAFDLKTEFCVLPREYEKPSPKGLDKILGDFDVYPQEAIFIGDSLTKDGLVAASRGIRFIWAHYGYQLPAEYEEIVNYSLKPEGDDEIHKPLPAPLITAIAARYNELLNLV
jgi:hypothetical protein